MLKERKNQHRKNLSSALGTGRSKRSSQEKSTTRSKSKDHSRNKELQNRILKRMSFRSPNKREDDSSSKNFSLLNYMVFKERAAHPSDSKPMRKDNFSVLEVLGKGGFGRVMKVQYKKNRKIYAMKEMSKTV